MKENNTVFTLKSKNQQLMGRQISTYIKNFLITYHTTSDNDLSIIRHFASEKIHFTQMVVSKRERQREEEEKKMQNLPDKSHS